MEEDAVAELLQAADEAALRRANRVLATLPGPTRLTRRAVVSFCLISPNSRRPPTKLVTSAGRLPDRCLDLAMLQTK